MPAQFHIDQSDEILALKKQVQALIMRAKYRDAVKLLQSKRKQYPQSYFIASRLATLPSEDAHGKKKEEAFRRAALQLRPLLRKMKGLPFEERVRNRNEYYWFSKQYLKQYRLGLEGVAAGLKRSYYSQGVGAVNYGAQLMLTGRRLSGLKWAKTAEKAWLNYFKKWRRDYHDSWLWYGFALGLQGRLEEMEAAFRESARLSRTSYRNNRYFSELRKTVQLARGV